MLTKYRVWSNTPLFDECEVTIIVYVEVVIGILKY